MGSRNLGPVPGYYRVRGGPRPRAAAPAGPRRGGGERGLTLVELAVVLGIVGMLMVLSGPSLRQWKAGIDLRGTAAEVSELMLSSRTRAIVERTTCTVSVDYATDACTVAPGGESVHDQGVDLYSDAGDPDCPPLSDRTLQFRPNGTADAAGYEAVYLKSRNAAVTTRYRVKVLGATGRVGVDKWRGGEWVSAR